MLKYVSKFTLDILPSVVATIVGAYIVNHYIVSKPGADAPVGAVLSTTEPKAEAKVAPEAAKADAKAPEKAPETSSGVAIIPEPGVKAKGISEKAILEKSAAEKPAEKSADKPAETASIPVETRRHQPREKAIAKSIPVPVQPSAPASVPVVAAPNIAPSVPPIEAAIAPDERRDANDLARAAIERLRGTSEGSPRAQETARTPDATRVPDASRIQDPARIVAAPPVRPLPPAIM